MSDVGMWGGQQAIPFGTDRHTQLVDALRARKRATENAKRTLLTRWTRDEEQYIGYMTETQIDARKKTGREAGYPDQVTIHVPYNYAMLMAAHTYMTSVLFARDPIWQVRGRHGEGQDKELIWEALLNYQTVAGGHTPHYYVWTHDCLRYGFGILGHYWCQDMINVTQRVTVPRTFAGVPIPGTSTSATQITTLPGYTGNRVYNVHPRDFGWDQRYPIARFQEGEYVYRSFEMSKLDILQSRTPGGQERFFNLDQVKPLMKGTSGFVVSSADLQTSALDIPQQQHMEAGYTLEVVNLKADEFYVRLNPKVWGLPGPDRIEKWVFLMIEERIIISAQPLGLMHDMFPFAATQAEVEGYDRAPRGMLHTTEGLNNTLTWLINSHFYNIRQALNDKIIVDPSRFVMADIMGPTAGRIIRLKPEHYGSEVDAGIKQLAIGDVTQSHIKDIGVVADMMQRALGINDTIMGAVNTGRRTATEVRSSTTLGINRLKTMVEYNSACAFDPFVQMLVMSTQQLMDIPMRLKVVGDLAKTSDQVLEIDPTAIAGFYDFIPVDGTLPIDRMAQVNVWSQLLQAMGQNPAVLAQFDVAGIFGFVAQLAGIRNLNRFKQPGMGIQVLPPGMAPPAGAQPVPPPTPKKAGNGLDNSGSPVGPQLPGMGPSL